MLTSFTNWPPAAFDAWLVHGLAERAQAVEPVLNLPADKRLTGKLLDRIKPPAGRRLSLRDPTVPGLECRIGSRGRVWYVTKKLAGKQRKTSLTFDAGDDEIEAARHAARTVRNAIKAGADPAGDRRRQRAVAKAGMVSTKVKTMAELIDAFGTAKGDRQRTWHNRRYTMRHNLQLVGALDLHPADFTEDHVKAILELGRQRGATVTVRRAVTYLRSVFRWGILRKHVKADPTAGIDRDYATELVGGTGERSRERILSDAELRALWPVLMARATSEHFAAAFALLLLTGQRRDELGGMLWADVDLEAGIWTQTINKADRPHLVPLVPTAVEIIRARRDAKGVHKDRVFSSSQGGPITEAGGGNWRKATVRFSKMAKIEPTWTRHDLRRTVATLASRLGHSLSAVQAILNHSPGKIEGITAIHRRHDRSREARAALEDVERFLLGGCVMPSAEIVRMEPARLGKAAG